MKKPNFLKNEIHCYDSGKKDFDRFTVVYMFEPDSRAPHYEARGMSANPCSPQGFGQITQATDGAHLGKRVDFDALPDECQRVVIRDCFGQKPEYIDDVLTGFLNCWAWADCEEGTHPRFPIETRYAARKLCIDFIDACGALFDAAIGQMGYDASRFGHDAWLTMNGHGAGFWDREELKTPAPGAFEWRGRDGRVFQIPEGTEIGEALTIIASGDNRAISKFSSPSAYQYRGWLYL